jgi:hypothetical protein
VRTNFFGRGLELPASERLIFIQAAMSGPNAITAQPLARCGRQAPSSKILTFSLNGLTIVPSVCHAMLFFAGTFVRFAPVGTYLLP